MSVILVHGGAGPHRLHREAKLLGVARAAEAGWAVLSSGGSALAAVEAATRALEDDPLFDAGFGSYLNEDGEVELDAIIMDGRDLRFGAVAAVQRVQNPVTLARHVLLESPHAMLAGPGAERFARRNGLCVPAPALVAPAILEEWRARQAGTLPDGYAADGVPDAAPLAGGAAALGDTVGAVAIDAAGHVAAATSTGGTAGKWAGRVGDSPIAGSGAYADDLGGAVSCTGQGERIMRVCLAYATSARMASGMSAMEACRAGLAELEARTAGQGGLIAVDRAAGLGWAWNTPGMPYAWRSDTGSGSGV